MIIIDLGSSRTFLRGCRHGEILRFRVNTGSHALSGNEVSGDGHLRYRVYLRLQFPFWMLAEPSARTLRPTRHGNPKSQDYVSHEVIRSGCGLFHFPYAHPPNAPRFSDQG